MHRWCATLLRTELGERLTDAEKQGVAGRDRQIDYHEQLQRGLKTDGVSPRPLHALLVDVGGTLWPERLSVHLSDDACVSHLACLLPTLHPAHTLAALRSALRDDDGSVVQDTYAVLRQAVQRLGAPCGEADVVAIRPALCRPAAPSVALFPGAPDFLRVVRDHGLRCVVLSNVQVRGAAEYWRDFHDLGVANLIDAVVTSLEVGYRKPHPAMFEAAVREAGCQADECVMVGDSQMKDIEPAVALGMRAIRVAIEEPAPTSSAAHAVATSLSDAAAMIAAWTSAAQIAHRG